MVQQGKWQRHSTSEICHSHSSKGVNVGPVGVDLQGDTEVWRKILPPSSGLKMETVCFSEMLVSTCKSAQPLYPQGQYWFLLSISFVTGQQYIASTHTKSTFNSLFKDKKMWLHITCFDSDHSFLLGGIHELWNLCLEVKYLMMTT
jgi:hypothetical protein